MTRDFKRAARRCARALATALTAVFLGIPLESQGQADASRILPIELEFQEASWFSGEVATALAYMKSSEPPELSIVDDANDMRILGTRIVPLADDDRGDYVGIIEFVSERAGIRVFPSLEARSGDSVSRTGPRQIVVGEPYISDDMALSIEIGDSTVYAGEPTRLDFQWRCDLPMNQIREVELRPAFFNDPSVEVVIPRSQAPEDEQFGVPVAERRVIARRQDSGESFPPRLGLLTFSVFLRFSDAGPYTIPSTRLLCSRLLEADAQSNRYAAYFNNALFEEADRSSPFEKIHAFSEPLQINVMPLPEKGRKESFSGLFDPVGISVETRPESLMVGQLMEIEVDIASAACSEMLRLPDLSRQPALRNRFWIGQEVREIWKPDGRRFVVRGRPLSTQINAFPGLAFQVFDKTLGDYRTVLTPPVPLNVTPREGLDYFPIEKIPGAQITIAANEEGVWHNYEAAIMNDLGNALVNTLSEGYLIIFAIGVLAMLFGSMWALDARKRSSDSEYHRRKAAYRKFKRRDSGVNGVQALRDLVAEIFGRDGRALTGKDAASLLRAAGVDENLVAPVASIIEKQDLAQYRPQTGDGTGSDRVGNLGRSVYRALSRTSAVLAILVLGGMANVSDAADWSQAEGLFDSALEFAESKSNATEINARFAEAALAFERCAESGIRPGIAWHNAGNAWFRAGEVGRSIANYKQARFRRPFDKGIARSLSAARALRIDRYASDSGSMSLPSPRWLRASFSGLWITTVVCVVLWIRYRNRVLGTTACLLLGACVLSGSLLAREAALGYVDGVIIADEVFARKGPGYAYVSAFMDPLHDGLEITVLEQRHGWLLSRLGDGSECWLPELAVMRLSR